MEKTELNHLVKSLKGDETPSKDLKQTKLESFNTKLDQLIKKLQQDVEVKKTTIDKLILKIKQKDDSIQNEKVKLNAYLELFGKSQEFNSSNLDNLNFDNFNDRLEKLIK